MRREVQIAVTSDSDMVPARAAARTLALELGFSRTDATLIATAVSEITRNIVVHAGRGEVEMEPVFEEHRFGLIVTARDKGPGIHDLDAALAHGYASRGGLGLGLPGARRLMDEFRIESQQEKGTTVTMTKWRRRDELERLREKRRPGR
jgi:anti-sigma regulatory factor (Ser/Thr protein kinase)